MRIDYKEFQAQMASELSALSAPSKEEKSSSRVIALELSEFSALPAGSKVRLEAVNVTKLQPGDYVLINSKLAPELRRFVSAAVAGGITRLTVANGSFTKEVVALDRLIGRVAEVQSDGKMVDPNPAGFLQRAAFRLRHR